MPRLARRERGPRRVLLYLPMIPEAPCSRNAPPASLSGADCLGCVFSAGLRAKPTLAARMTTRKPFADRPPPTPGRAAAAKVIDLHALLHGTKRRGPREAQNASTSLPLDRPALAPSGSTPVIRVALATTAPKNSSSDAHVPVRKWLRIERAVLRAVPHLATTGKRRACNATSAATRSRWPHSMGTLLSGQGADLNVPAVRTWAGWSGPNKLISSTPPLNRRSHHRHVRRHAESVPTAHHLGGAFVAPITGSI